MNNVGIVPTNKINKQKFRKLILFPKNVVILLEMCYNSIVIEKI